MSESPVFPFRIRWLDSGEVDEFGAPEELICDLEDFDSNDAKCQAEAVVVDALGRSVSLFVSILEGRCEYSLQ